MDQRSNKDVYVILAVIAAIVVLAVAFTWSRDDRVEAPLDTEPRTAPAAISAP